MKEIKYSESGYYTDKTPESSRSFKGKRRVPIKGKDEMERKKTHKNIIDHIHETFKFIGCFGRPKYS